MTCAHCLRGDAQNADIDESILREVLSKTSRISSVTFSGGEPSLVLDKIELFYQIAREFDVVPASFYIATNGAENQLDLAKLCLELYASSDERECCGVALSVDDYHDASRQSDIIRGLTFYHDDKEMYYEPRVREFIRRRGAGDAFVMVTGRAVENAIGTRRRPLAAFDVEERDDEILVDTAYVSTNGRLYADCDASYKEMDAMPGVPAETMDAKFLAIARGE